MKLNYWKELYPKHQVVNTHLVAKEAAVEGPNFAEQSGWHLYTELNFPATLSSADDQKMAIAYLALLQEYTTAAQIAGMRHGIEILEVQGRRLHLFLEAATPSKEYVLRIQAFSAELIRHIDARIKPKVVSDKLAFRVTADHGAAIMVLSAYADESDSVVSLGDAANYPAKRLTKIDSRVLSVNMGAFTSPDIRKWEDFRLDSLPMEKIAVDHELDLAVNEAFTLQNRTLAASFVPKPDNGVEAPLLYRGYMFRADLEGFTAKVRKAMAGTDKDKQRLATEFTAIMQYPSQFKDKIQGHAQVMLFPWAGDCANMLLIPKDYSFARKYLPNRAGIDWHELRGATSLGGRKWAEILSETQWVAGIAGGDDAESDHGFTLVGRVFAYGRSYLVGGGWGWGRSQDAIQVDTAKPEETLIHVEDHRGLGSQYQKAYSADGIYHKASLAALKACEGKLAAMLEEQKPHVIQTSEKKIYAPAPRPYAPRP